MAAKWKSRRIGCGDEDLSSEFPDYEVVEHKILQFTNIDGGKFGNNKFFSLELHKCSNGKWRVYTNYHKVPDGEYVGAFEVRGPGTEAEMRAEFDSLYKKKTGSRKGRDQYRDVKFIKAKVGSPKARLITRKVDESEIPVDKKKKVAKAKKRAPSTQIKLDPEVTRLIEDIFKDSSQTLTSAIDVNITADGFETPLGVLSYSQIDDGRGILVELGKAVKKKNDSEVRKLTSKYFSVIPHKLGHDVTGQVIDTDTEVQQESDILQLMHDSLEVGASTFVDGTSQKYLELGVDIAFMNSNGHEAKRITNYIDKTISRRHSFARGFKVNRVFKVILPHDRSRYDKCKIGNEMELFHGSRNCNIIGILKRGLLIAPPEAPVSGYMFDKGVYFADKSTKSLQYSMKSFGSYNQSGNICYLFLVKVRLGKQLILEDACYHAASRCRKEGYDSVLGKAGRSLLHNEFITYSLEQCTITHVVEIQKPHNSYY